MPDDLTDAQKEWAVRAALQREAETGRRLSRGNLPPEPPTDDAFQSVVLTRIDVSIGNLVIVMLKLLIALIPVAIVVTMIAGLVRAALNT